MIEEVKTILGDVLQLGNRTQAMDADTALLGNIPEFDSMAVVAVITALEDHFGFVIEDDEVSAETFETVGSLVKIVEEKISG